MSADTETTNNQTEPKTSTAKRVATLLCRPILENVEFFFFTGILGLFCPLIADIFCPWHLFLWVLFFDTYIGCALLSLTPRKVRPWVRGLFYVLIYWAAFIEAFLISVHGVPISPTIFLLVNETNTHEATEYLKTALSAISLMSGTGLVIGIICLHAIYSLLKFDFLQKAADAVLVRSKAFRIFASVVIIASLPITAHNNRCLLTALAASTTGELELLLPKALMFMPLDRLAYSVRCNQLSAEQIDHLKTSIDDVRVDSCSFTSPNIVLIIGESYTRHHSQLYGYPVPTTPRQVEREERGELIPFTDVVTPWNITSFVFKHFFTTYAIGEEGEWSDSPLFPVFFRKAGYHVTFITNQFVPKTLYGSSPFAFSGGFFLNNPTLSEAQFDERNNEDYPLDSGIVHSFDSICAKQQPHGLHIIHLRGQHTSYDSRYPADFAKFKAEDYYTSRPELTAEQCEIVSTYDNATLYNDSIVNELMKRFEDRDAIVIYVPDHGEETYDDGRTQSERYIGPDMDYSFAKAEFEIPFWMWASESYRQNHPDIWQSVRQAKDKPLMTDAVAHTLLHLAGISCKDYKATLDVLSPEYDAHRPRLLRKKDDYDLLRAGAYAKP